MKNLGLVGLKKSKVDRGLATYGTFLMQVEEGMYDAGTAEDGAEIPPPRGFRQDIGGRMEGGQAGPSVGGGQSVTYMPGPGMEALAGGSTPGQFHAGQFPHGQPIAYPMAPHVAPHGFLYMPDQFAGPAYPRHGAQWLGGVATPPMPPEFYYGGHPPPGHFA